MSSSGAKNTKEVNILSQILDELKELNLTLKKITLKGQEGIVKKQENSEGDSILEKIENL